MKRQLAVLYLLLLSHCGTEIGNPKKPDGGGTTKASVLSDRDYASNVLGFEIGGILNPVNDESSSSEQSLALVDSQYSSVCSQNADGTVKVEKIFSGTKTSSAKRHGIDLTQTSEGDDQSTMTWQKDGATLNCNASNTRIALQMGSGLDGLKLTVARDKSLTIKITGQNKTFAERKEIFQGSRNIMWSVSKRVISRSIEWDTQQSVEFKIKDLTKKVELSSQSIKNITLSHTLGSDSRTFESGVVRSILKDDAVAVETTIENIKFDSRSDCLPSSGIIIGRILGTGSADAVLETFQIDFAKIDSDTGRPNIVWSNGDEIGYEGGLCNE